MFQLAYPPFKIKSSRFEFKPIFGANLTCFRSRVSLVRVRLEYIKVCLRHMLLGAFL